MELHERRTRLHFYFMATSIMQLINAGYFIKRFIPFYYVKYLKSGVFLKQLLQFNF